MFPETDETTPDVEQSGPSLRDTLSAAFEDGDAPEPVADDVSTPEAPEQETAAQAAARARDEAGRFAKKPAPKVEVKPTVPAAKTPVKPVTPVKPTNAPTVAIAAQATATAPEMKAPQAWRGPAKEVWAQLPEAARVEVLRREKEISTQLTAMGEERKYAQAMRSAVGPFEAQIRAEGSTPERAVASLMQTALALRTAPPAHKAHLVAGMIADFGVPLDALVAALQGHPAPETQQHAAPVDPATIAAQVKQQLVRELGAQRESALVSRYTAQTESFLESQPVHGLDGTDYGQEIREDMADIIERAAKRGLAITLEQAYSRAAREHPEVSKVLAQREAAAAAAKANASTQRARAASSSVRHSPTTQPVTRRAGGDLRSALEASVEALSG